MVFAATTYKLSQREVIEKAICHLCRRDLWLLTSGVKKVHLHILIFFPQEEAADDGKELVF